MKCDDKNIIESEPKYLDLALTAVDEICSECGTRIGLSVLDDKCRLCGKTRKRIYNVNCN